MTIVTKLLLASIAYFSTKIPLVLSESDNFVTSDVEFKLILDNVMGGISTAQLDTTEVDDTEILSFDGELSLENNGGFAMFRGYIGEQCKGYNQLHIMARTDSPEREYKVLVSTLNGSGFFEIPIELEEEYKSVIIDMKDMTCQLMGWGMPWLNGPTGDRVRWVGMIVFDKNTDPFQVDIQEIQCI